MLSCCCDSLCLPPQEICSGRHVDRLPCVQTHFVASATLTRTFPRPVVLRTISVMPAMAGTEAQVLQGTERGCITRWATCSERLVSIRTAQRSVPEQGLADALHSSMHDSDARLSSTGTIASSTERNGTAVGRVARRYGCKAHRKRAARGQVWPNR